MWYTNFHLGAFLSSLIIRRTILIVYCLTRYFKHNDVNSNYYRPTAWSTLKRCMHSPVGGPMHKLSDQQHQMKSDSKDHIFYRTGDERATFSTIEHTDKPATFSTIGHTDKPSMTLWPIEDISKVGLIAINTIVQWLYFA